MQWYGHAVWLHSASHSKWSACDGPLLCRMYGCPPKAIPARKKEYCGKTARKSYRMESEQRQDLGLQPVQLAAVGQRHNSEGRVDAENLAHISSVSGSMRRVLETVA